MKTTCPSPSTTARSMWASAARWKRRWRQGKLSAVVCTSTLELGHRLGRRGPRDPCGCAQGLEPPAAADRPLQSPAGQPLAKRCWCPPTASRCWNARRPCRRPRRMPRTRNIPWSSSSTCWRSTSWAGPVPGPFAADELFAEVTRRLDLPQPHPRRFRQGDRLCGHRRLRARAYERYAKLNAGPMASGA